MGERRKMLFPFFIKSPTFLYEYGLPVCVGAFYKEFGEKLFPSAESVAEPQKMIQKKIQGKGGFMCAFP